MAEPLQINRQYLLKVGNSQSGEGIEINSSLQMTFDVTKTSDNKKKTNRLAIDIYNLNDDHIKILDTDYPAAYLSVGYRDIGIKQIFGGQVTEVQTRKSGTDRITRLTFGSAYQELNHGVMNQLVSPGKTLQDAIDEIRKQLPNVSKAVYNGSALSNTLIYGYPLTGTPKDMMSEICDKYDLEWQIDDDTLYVHDNTRGNRENFEEAYVVSKYTGLIENAYRISGDNKRSKKDKAKIQGVQWKMLLNPDIQAGDIVKLEDTFIEGWYKVTEIRHYGGFRDQGWFSDVKATAIEKVVKS